MRRKIYEDEKLILSIFVTPPLDYCSKIFRKWFEVPILFRENNLRLGKYSVFYFVFISLMENFLSPIENLEKRVFGNSEPPLGAKSEVQTRKKMLFFQLCWLAKGKKSSIFSVHFLKIQHYPLQWTDKRFWELRKHIQVVPHLKGFGHTHIFRFGG